MVPWKPIAAALVIFAAGVASGVMGTRLYEAKTDGQPARIPGNPPGPWWGPRMDFMRRMGDRLGLSETQKQRIDTILRESQQRVRELWDPLAPKLKEEMESVRKLIDAELTPEQRAKAELLSKERFSGQPGERQPGRWREGDGSRMRGRGPERGAPAVPGEGPPPPGEPPPENPPSRPPEGGAPP